MTRIEYSPISTKFIHVAYISSYFRKIYVSWLNLGLRFLLPPILTMLSWCIHDFTHHALNALQVDAPVFALSRVNELESFNLTAEAKTKLLAMCIKQCISKFECILMSSMWLKVLTMIHQTNLIIETRDVARKTFGNLSSSEEFYYFTTVRPSGRGCSRKTTPKYSLDWGAQYCYSWRWNG